MLKIGRRFIVKQNITNFTVFHERREFGEENWHKHGKTYLYLSVNHKTGYTNESFML